MDVPPCFALPRAKSEGQLRGCLHKAGVGPKAAGAKGSWEEERCVSLHGGFSCLCWRVCDGQMLFGFLPGVLVVRSGRAAPSFSSQARSKCGKSCFFWALEMRQPKRGCVGRSSASPLPMSTPCEAKALCGHRAVPVLFFSPPPHPTIGCCATGDFCAGSGWGCRAPSPREAAAG